MKHQVWFDFGSNYIHHEFNTLPELNAFIEGVQAACDARGIDYEQFDTRKAWCKFMDGHDEAPVFDKPNKKKRTRK